jgi:hypothetical protein
MFKKLCALALLFSISAAMGMNPKKRPREIKVHFTQSTRNSFRFLPFVEGVGFVRLSKTQLTDGTSYSLINEARAKELKLIEKPVMFGPGAAMDLRKI